MAEIFVMIPRDYDVIDPRIRRPKPGELCYIPSRKKVTRNINYCGIIVKPAWKWPNWLKAGWLFYTEDHGWVASDSKPVWRGAWCPVSDVIRLAFTDLIPPKSSYGLYRRPSGLNPVVACSFDLPPEYELVDVHLRTPVPGEVFLNWCDLHPEVCHDNNMPGLSIIVRSIWKWPEWLTARYIFWAEDRWLATNLTPVLSGRTWFPQNNSTVIDLSLTTFEPPPNFNVYSNPNNPEAQLLCR